MSEPTSTTGITMEAAFERIVRDELIGRTAVKRLKQKDVAAALGLSQTSVSESYRDRPLNLREFVRRCLLVEVDPVALFRHAMNGAAQ